MPETLHKGWKMEKAAPPQNDAVCTKSCSGCDGCDTEDKVRLKEISTLRSQDAKIDLKHIAPKKDQAPVQHVLMEFEYDLPHSFVFPGYWNCEIRRALNLSGIKYDIQSVSTTGSDRYSGISGAGLNVTCISLFERIEPSELKRRISEHALNFKIRSIKEIDSPVRVSSVSYCYPLPDGTDEEMLSKLIMERLSEKEWVRSFSGETKYSVWKRDFRPSVTEAYVKDGYLYFTSKRQDYDPLMVLCCLMDLPVSSKLPSLPFRTGFSFEKKGLLDLAMTKN